MRAIILEAEAFAEEFDKTLEKLELEKLRGQKLQDPELRQLFEEVHRKFHYEVCCLRNRLERRK